ncbi:MAG: protein jag [Deltaproteobacteria bacterium]|nr:protein jag [Deltaproteobacteria bacterium]
MEFQEFEGKSTEEAIESACAHFQVPSEQLEIEIVSVGSPGLFGLGSRKAKIRAALREDGEIGESTLAQGREILQEFLEKMHEPGRVTAEQEDDRIVLRIETEDPGVLIGKQGQTLDALQYLVTKILSKKTRKKIRITLDVEAYRARHNDALTQMALKYGEKVKRSGKAVTLSPMNPYDRRIIHLALQGDKDLKTMSRGEGLYKKVVISPARKRESQEESAASG